MLASVPSMELESEILLIGNPDSGKKQHALGKLLSPVSQIFSTISGVADGHAQSDVHGNYGEQSALRRKPRLNSPISNCRKRSID